MILLLKKPLELEKYTRGTKNFDYISNFLFIFFFIKLIDNQY